MHMHMGGDPSAICAQTDPELWFPDKGQSTRDAKRMCMRCPLLDECRALALRDPHLLGVWGGLSAQERRRIRKGASA